MNILNFELENNFNMVTLFDFLNLFTQYFFGHIIDEK